MKVTTEVKNGEAVGLAVLVHSHFGLAALVEKADQIFGPIIVTYFATQAKHTRGLGWTQLLETVHSVQQILHHIQYSGHCNRCSVNTLAILYWIQMLPPQKPSQNGPLTLLPNTRLGTTFPFLFRVSDTNFGA